MSQNTFIRIHPFPKEISWIRLCEFIFHRSSSSIKHNCIKPKLWVNEWTDRRMSKRIYLPSNSRSDSKGFLNPTDACFHLQKDISVVRKSLVMLNPAASHQRELPVLDHLFQSLLSIVILLSIPLRQIVSVRPVELVFLVLLQRVEHSVQNAEHSLFVVLFFGQIPTCVCVRVGNDEDVHLSNT